MMKRVIRAAFALALLVQIIPAQAASILQYKGGYESGTTYTGQTGANCNVANNAFCAIGTAFDNTSNKFIRGTAVFYPGATWTPVGGPVSCWLVESVDGGSTYEVTPSGSTVYRQPDFTFTIQPGTTVQDRAYAFNVIIKPGYQKMICFNEVGTTIPNNTTVVIYPWQIQQQ